MGPSLYSSVISFLGNGGPPLLTSDDLQQNVDVLGLPGPFHPRTGDGEASLLF